MSYTCHATIWQSHSEPGHLHRWPGHFFFQRDSENNQKDKQWRLHVYQALYPIIYMSLLCTFGVWNRQVPGCQENDCRRRGSFTKRSALCQGIMTNRRGRIVSKRIKKWAINYPAVELCSVSCITVPPIRLIGTASGRLHYACSSE